MIMQKLLSIVLAARMVAAGLAGCGSSTAETKAPETTAAAGEKSGCSSVIGGAVAVVLTAMAAGVALKKKH